MDSAPGKRDPAENARYQKGRCAGALTPTRETSMIVKKIITSPLPAHNFASSTSLN